MTDWRETSFTENGLPKMNIHITDTNGGSSSFITVPEEEYNQLVQLAQLAIDAVTFVENTDRTFLVKKLAEDLADKYGFVLYD